MPVRLEQFYENQDRAQQFANYTNGTGNQFSTMLLGLIQATERGLVRRICRSSDLFEGYSDFLA
jgi:hypothetical protein